MDEPKKKKRKRRSYKKRECLRCGKIFLSEGKYNRVCHSCREMNANIASGMIFEDNGGFAYRR